MPTVFDPNASRRQFFRFLAASPLVAKAAESGPASSGAAATVKTPGEALDVFDFEAAARARLPPAHWGFIATGVDDDLTLAANREGFKKIRLRPRMLRDVTTIDTTVDLFGTK